MRNARDTPQRKRGTSKKKNAFNRRFLHTRNKQTILVIRPYLGTAVNVYQFNRIVGQCLPVCSLINIYKPVTYIQHQKPYIPIALYVHL